MEELFSDVGSKADVAVGAVSAAGAWFATKFEWWKNSESKLVKIGVPLGIFLVVALFLSAIT